MAARIKASRDSQVRFEPPKGSASNRLKWSREVTTAVDEVDWGVLRCFFARAEWVLEQACTWSMKPARQQKPARCTFTVIINILKAKRPPFALHQVGCSNCKCQLHTHSRLACHMKRSKRPEPITIPTPAEACLV